MDSMPNNIRAKVDNTKSFILERYGYCEKDGTGIAFSIAPYLTARCEVTFYANQVRCIPLDLKYPPNTPPEREENDIQTFSQKSRMRLFSLITQIDYKTYGTPIFVSNTFHHDAPDSRLEIKTTLDNYVKRLKRNLRQFSAVWKLEYQERGTPHFHFIILPHNKDDRFFLNDFDQTIRDHWFQLKKCKCQDCKNYHTNVKQINDFSHMMIYISKEIAKLQERYLSHNLGRVWGYSRDLRLIPYKRMEMTFGEYRDLLGDVLLRKDLPKDLDRWIIAIRNFCLNSTLFIPFDFFPELLDSFNISKKFTPNTPKKLHMKKYHFTKVKENR